MKTLVLCRHAKSDWPLGVGDINRPLKKRGIEDAQRLGELLASHQFDPDYILSSPATRAQSTAELIAQQINFTSEIQINQDIYFGGMVELLQVIKELPQTADTVMIFGHNPTMENTVRYLQRSQLQFDMPTLGMACFENNTLDWGEFANNYCRLRWLQVPRLKRKDI